MSPFTGKLHKQNYLVTWECHLGRNNSGKLRKCGLCTIMMWSWRGVYTYRWLALPRRATWEQQLYKSTTLWKFQPFRRRLGCTSSHFFVLPCRYYPWTSARPRSASARTRYFLRIIDRLRLVVMGIKPTRRTEVRTHFSWPYGTNICQKIVWYRISCIQHRGSCSACSQFSNFEVFNKFICLKMRVRTWKGRSDLINDRNAIMASDTSQYYDNLQWPT